MATRFLPPFNGITVFMRISEDNIFCDVLLGTHFRGKQKTRHPEKFASQGDEIYSRVYHLRIVSFLVEGYIRCDVDGGGDGGDGGRSSSSSSSGE